MSDTPLIYTSKGNVPIDSLRYEHKWIDTKDETTLVEFWFDASDEVVKKNVHMFGRKPLEMGGQQAVMA
jgi:hypothetical protein